MAGILHDNAKTTLRIIKEIQNSNQKASLKLAKI